MAHELAGAHRNFDRLADTHSSDRSRDDLISLSWFDYLEEKLKVCNGVRKYVNKFIAHAADPKSREELSSEETTITLNHLRSCQRSIYQVAAFIYGPLFWAGSYGAVPVPQYDHLQNLDKVWIAPERKDKERQFWRDNLHVVEAWEREDLWSVFAAGRDTSAEPK